MFHLTGYNPSFNYGGVVASADEDDTVNSLPPYLSHLVTNITSSFSPARGCQLASKSRPR